MDNHNRQHFPILRLLSLLICFGLVAGLIASCLRRPEPNLTPLPPALTATSTLSPTPAPTQTPYVITATSAADTPAPSSPKGCLFLSLADADYYHLFSYSTQSFVPTRLTVGNWDDVSPALSPDGSMLAFASNRNGYWNLYTLDLQTGAVSRLTNSPEYKGDPSWSPDGAWIAYDGLRNGSLHIFLLPYLDSTQSIKQLTVDPVTDAYPAWSPQGREIAFVSNRSGEPEIWVANLDSLSFMNVSKNPRALESHPAWSPDATRLAWAATDQATGLSGIYLWDSAHSDAPAQWVGSGNLPVWQDASHLVAGLATPNQFFLTGFDLSGSLTLPLVLLPGLFDGLAYGNISVQMPGPFQDSANQTPAPLFESDPEPQSGGETIGRANLVSINGLQAPYPELQEAAVASFQALRNRAALSAGWDALASLENAFIPLTTSLDPGRGDDWLYTGRAFSLNPVLIDAGWMAITREDFGQQTFWRIYLKTTAQDGSQGSPLLEVPWDFFARTGNASAYENGGQLMAKVPSGYWMDLTSLALQYGWQRLPALTNWRTFYAGARYNELAFTQGLDWRSAMLQLYPPEVLITPTLVVPPTRTPTRTPLWYRTPTPTRTPTNLPTNTP